jgi:hypothetical protein
MPRIGLVPAASAVRSLHAQGIAPDTTRPYHQVGLIQAHWPVV